MKDLLLKMKQLPKLLMGIINEVSCRQQQIHRLNGRVFCTNEII